MGGCGRGTGTLIVVGGETVVAGVVAFETERSLLRMLWR